MNTLSDALQNALQIVLALDPHVIEYALRSLYIALASTLVALVLAVPMGVFLAETEFAGKRILVTLLNTLLSVPTVVVGLLVYSFVSSKGPLGHWELIFTVPAIIMGEVLLIVPLMTALTLAAVSRIDRDVRMTALALGASRTQALWAVFCESRFGILAAVIAGYGRVIGEVGVAMMVGGSADGFTRTLTTSIMHHVDQGHFEMALAIGMVLLTISFALNICFQWLQGAGRSR